MAPTGKLTLFRVRGIRIGVDYSWFFVLFLIILWLSGFYRDVLETGGSATAPYLLAVASAFAFFGSILLHELGHAVVANRLGVPITEITLWLFGGVARMSKDTESPGAEFKIAAAGPAVTLLLAIGFTAIGIAAAGSEDFWAAVRLDPTTQISGVLAMVAWLAQINLLVLIFNLIPAFPLDGGRIARAIAWRLTGNRNKATRFAANVGRGFSYALIALGIGLVARRRRLRSPASGWRSSGSSSASRRAATRCSRSSRAGSRDQRGRRDGRRPGFLTEDTSIERAIDEYFLRYRWPWFPVVDAGDHFRGLLVREAADDVPEPSRSSQTSARSSSSTPRGRCGSATTPRSSRCSATMRCGGSAGSRRSTPTGGFGA